MKRSMLTTLAATLVLAGCAGGETPSPGEPPAAGAVAETAAWTPPRGLEGVEMSVPADNPITAAKIELGELLFFDTRLSRTKDMACLTCHLPEKGWTDGRKLSPKFDGSMNTRHSPTLYGTGFYPELYWDGRAIGLETQILAAWKGNMGADPEGIAGELDGIPGYASRFENAFGGPATGDRIVKALATFVRTLQAGDTEWDRHPQDDASLESSAIGRGFKVFTEVAQCSLCHAPPLFSDMDFHNTGVGYDTDQPDLGRGKALAARAEKAGQPAPPEAATLQGAFKTPSLRGVALTAPYLHDGRFDTLEETVDFMLAGGLDNPHLDEKMKKRDLTEEQRNDLLAFLHALTPATSADRPELP
mgnify:CR=1 FL=1